jgi:hypothetical protein
VDVEASFPAHGEPAELVEQGEALLHDVAQLAERFDTNGYAAVDVGTALVIGGDTLPTSPIGLELVDAARILFGRAARTARPTT